jgi:hypothetical protein
MVKMDEFLATRFFFLGPNFAKNNLLLRNFASKKNIVGNRCHENIKKKKEKQNSQGSPRHP